MSRIKIMIAAVLLIAAATGPAMAQQHDPQEEAIGTADAAAVLIWALVDLEQDRAQDEDGDDVDEP